MFDSVGLNLPLSMSECLETIFNKAKIINPMLNKKLFIQGIISDWLELYQNASHGKIYKKNEVILRNNLKTAIKLCGKTQAQVAQEIDIDRVYLGHVIRGKSDPSVTVALLLMYAVNYPQQKFTDLFFIEPK